MAAMVSVSPTKAHVLRTDPQDASGRQWNLWEVEPERRKLGHWRNDLKGTTEIPSLDPPPLHLPLPSLHPIPLFLAAMKWTVSPLSHTPFMMCQLTTGPKTMTQMIMN